MHKMRWAVAMLLVALAAGRARAYDPAEAAREFKSEFEGEPPAVPVQGGWQGQDSRVVQEDIERVLDAAGWKALWQRHAPGTPAPEVDFKKAMVVAVFWGELKNDGRWARLRSVTESPGNSFIDIVLDLYLAGDLIPKKTVRPYLFVVLPRSASAVSVVLRSSVMMTRPEVAYRVMGELQRVDLKE